VFYKNETKHIIELSGTEQRIRAKTCWNADTLRGDFADVLILDEFQLMNEDTWGTVGAPMLLDNNGDAIFIYTPPSLTSRSVSKANDPQHAAKMYKKAATDTSGRWQAYTFSSYDNPHLPKAAIDELASDMSSISYRMEIMAEDIDEAPGALWRRANIEKHRLDKVPDLVRVVVGIDPSGTDKTSSDEAGVLTAGIDSKGHGYILDDSSGIYSPNAWAYKAITAYNTWDADRIIGEVNYGGDMIETVIRNLDPDVPYKSVSASRGKYIRAEPIAALYERGLVHHVGHFNKLEDEMCLWLPGDKSPNRMDALVWSLTELMTKSERKFTIR
jgi:phage terminase large subunit-like protein